MQHLRIDVVSSQMALVVLVPQLARVTSDDEVRHLDRLQYGFYCILARPVWYSTTAVLRNMSAADGA